MAEMPTITLTKEESRVLAQLCNAATDGHGYFYRGKTMKRVAARIHAKLVVALAASPIPAPEPRDA